MSITEADFGEAHVRLVIFAMHGEYDWSNDPEAQARMGIVESAEGGAPDASVDAATDDLWRALFAGVRAARLTTGMMQPPFYHGLTRIANELRRRLIADRLSSLPTYCHAPADVSHYCDEGKDEAGDEDS